MAEEGALEKNKGKEECTFIWCIQGHIPWEGDNEQIPTETREGAMPVSGGRAFQAERKASERALKLKCVRCVLKELWGDEV